jgi:hypothetical protein
MRNWLKTLLIISAFSPTLLALAGVRYFLNGSDVVFYQLIIISLLGTSLPFLILFLVEKESEALTFKAKKVKSADHMLLVFVGTYIAPVVMKMVEIDFGITVIVVVVLACVSWVIPSVPSHPIMYLLKYRFYEVESDKGMVYTLISKRVIRNPGSISKVRQLSNSMIME